MDGEGLIIHSSHTSSKNPGSHC